MRVNGFLVLARRKERTREEGEREKEKEREPDLINDELSLPRAWRLSSSFAPSPSSSSCLLSLLSKWNMTHTHTGRETQR